MTIAVLFALPLIALRGRTLGRCLAAQAALFLLAVVAWRQVPQFDF